MSVAPSAPISPHDPLRLQEEPGIEFAHGQIVVKPMSVGSSRVESKICRLLANDAAKANLAQVFTSSMGYQCFPEEPSRFRKPDVSVVRSERLAGVDPQTALLPSPPDLAVEVISPTDIMCDVTDKVEEYLRNGFPLVWVVHPNTRSAQVYRAGERPLMLREQDEITADPVLPTFRCQVAEFFRF